MLGAVVDDGGAELLEEAVDLVGDAAGDVPVAVVVDGDRGLHPDLLGAGQVGGARVAGDAGGEIDLGRVGVVAGDAAVGAVDVAEPDVVALPRVLVPALGPATVERGGSRRVVHVGELEHGADGVVVGRRRGGDLGVDGGSRRS